MHFHQKKNKNNISLAFGEDHLLYTLKDETTNRTEKVSYENILNEKYEFYENNKAYKNNAIYAGVVGAIFLAINIFYGTKLWAWLFMLACPIFFYLYYRSKAAFTVIKTDGDINMFILQDEQHDEVIESIYKSRNSYLQDKYLSINYDNDPQLEMNKFAWLLELGVINGREFRVIRDEIENSLA
ncbi:hypothetical protein JAO76_07875 [Pontibacter sp. BT310]|uniref:YcxB-like protein domain-containing protein n=1 Tax=Pontibacter populi TaxID=890055 RepID=A0ABS6XCX4_9BACT|nr:MULTISPECIES: hypothetical protein [Pontibacter]MBJ6118103.1 hypothetical protein [Pontibacter sp. BT310]MBR0570530.1 hypothetical protein [Microvirga sp. STS03]MBW3364956.1 hypothetical protein [Pontibacter populi]